MAEGFICGFSSRCGSHGAGCDKKTATVEGCGFIAQVSTEKIAATAAFLAVMRENGSVLIPENDSRLLRVRTAAKNLADVELDTALDNAAKQFIIEERRSAGSGDSTGIQDGVAPMSRSDGKTKRRLGGKQPYFVST